MANIVVNADEANESRFSGIANAIKTHVKSPNKVSELTRILERASHARGEDVSFRDFLRLVGDSDIREYSLNDIKVEEFPRVTRATTSPEQTSPEQTTPEQTTPAQIAPGKTAPDPVTPTGERRKRIVLLVILVILMIVAVVWYIIRRVGKGNADGACPDACNVECSSLNDLAIAKCVPCDHTKACNPKADGFSISQLKEQTQTIPKDSQTEVSSVPTAGIKVHLEIVEGVSVTPEDKIVFSSLRDVKLTVPVSLKDLKFVGSKHTLSLPEQTYFATARTVGTRAHFQSSGVVENDSVIRFGPNAVEVNAK